jgi:hypothetical protein
MVCLVKHRATRAHSMTSSRMTFAFEGVVLQIAPFHSSGSVLVIIKILVLMRRRVVKRYLISPSRSSATSLWTRRVLEILELENSRSFRQPMVKSSWRFKEENLKTGPGMKT